MSIPNSFDNFMDTLNDSAPNANWPDELKCLWYDAKGDWTTAHDIAQEMHNAIGSRLHAYLHRKEGDQWNAKYWYNKAEKQLPKIGLEEEFYTIVNDILNEY